MRDNPELKDVDFIKDSEMLAEWQVLLYQPSRMFDMSRDVFVDMHEERLQKEAPGSCRYNTHPLTHDCLVCGPIYRHGGCPFRAP